MPKSTFRIKQAFWLLLPTLIWAGLFLNRSIWYRPWCAVETTPCVENAVEEFDRIVFQFHSVFADVVSNWLQNGVGALMLIAAWFLLRKWNLIQKIFYYLIALTLWNGALLEATRALVQRPRPLVFRNPMGDGSNIAQYTSFYSGHTSFVAMATLASFLWINQAYPLGRSRRVAFAAYMLLTSVTAVLRVLGGRHFPSDVLGAIVAGTLVALGGFAFFRHSLPKANDLVL